MYPLMFEYHHLLKLLMIGNSGVGKSSLLNRFADDNFRELYIYTIGVDFKVRTLEINGKTVKLQIWDTAGQERFRAFTAAYFRGAHGIVVVYDISDRRSFNSVTNWLRDIELNCPDRDVSVLLVGHKCDMEYKRVVSYEEGKEFADGLGILFLEASAKDDINVEQAFKLIAANILDNLNNKELTQGEQLTHRYKSIIDISTPDVCNKWCCPH